VRNILEVLVKQTLERHPEFHDLIEQTYAQHLREDTEPTEAQLLTLLRRFTEGMTVTFYILDALDEAPKKIQLAVVEALASLNVKLFITSRPLDAVVANFTEAHTFRISAQDADISLHFAKITKENPDLFHADPSFRDEVVSIVKENCGGM
jgi:ankyrin repeat domain-containing protein 50